LISALVSRYRITQFHHDVRGQFVATIDGWRFDSAQFLSVPFNQPGLAQHFEAVFQVDDYLYFYGDMLTGERLGTGREFTLQLKESEARLFRVEHQDSRK
jgi:hypothetical protein